ncbi:hypothetical protein [Mycolicibacterium insubricum]|uniref:hypothetical protein n=1 Tax=Mycolicibacterium insubricum TaxID=444597 RepID=UPI0021F30067|nr:hypothetical protein [Mycolicibacterium insubricum]MCV7083101.1 hypothetical protein [Mycolicibacterium insubricum]
MPIFDSGEIDNRLFISMPLIDGTDLGHPAARRGTSPEPAVAAQELPAGLR